MITIDTSPSDALDDGAAEILDRLDAGNDCRASLFRDFLRHTGYARKRRGHP
jgi:hypothetical protein